MEPMQALVLGAIQGLTEFFPVSSSGHLVIFQQMMGFKEPALMFDISVHVGTLVAILIYFFSDIIRIFKSLIHLSSSHWGRPRGNFSSEEVSDAHMAWMIIIGSLPTAVIGFGFHMISDVLFSSLLLVGISLIITGAILLGTRWINQQKAFGSDLSVKQALMIGTIQGLAVIPGISRSGSTISAALFAGVNREIAIRYSFLMSIPAILGAVILQIATGPSGGGTVSPGAIVSGMGASLVVGYIALSLLVKIVQKGRLYFFTPYCMALGAVVLMAGI